MTFVKMISFFRLMETSTFSKVPSSSKNLIQVEGDYSRGSVFLFYMCNFLFFFFFFYFFFFFFFFFFSQYSNNRKLKNLKLSIRLIFHLHNRKGINYSMSRKPAIWSIFLYRSIQSHWKY
jgi:hypothetical protein